MTKGVLIKELYQLNAEIGRLEARIAMGEAGIIEHILLVATQRTQATTEQAIRMSAESLRPRTTLPTRATSLQPRG
jgi:hypothetical protein